MKVEGEVSGTIKSVGSDTMNNLMAFGPRASRRCIPTSRSKSKARARPPPRPALIAGTANFGPMSREMKKQEMDAFETKFGYKPTGVPTAVDVLAVYVNKDNPIQGLTHAASRCHFFQDAQGRLFDKDIATWGDLGLTGEWADKPISLYGRNSASGTYGFFKEHAPQERRLQGIRQGTARAAPRLCRGSPATSMPSAIAGSATRRSDVSRCRWPRRATIHYRPTGACLQWHVSAFAVLIHLRELQAG